MDATTRSTSIPRATYRLQLHRDFTFRDARAVVPHLASLGISHLYTSPIVKARPGSMHGYDVIDHNVLNPELGTREDLEALSRTLREHAMQLIVDIVPNHVGIMGDGNAWWLDVLENGPAAEAAPYFDIDWCPNRTTMHNRVLVPVLGDAYGNVLERGELVLQFDAGTAQFSVSYFQHRFPIDPREYPRIFARHQALLETLLPDDEETRADFASLLDAFGRLPKRTETTAEARLERYRDKEVYRRRLLRLCERQPEVSRYIEAVLTALNGTVGEPKSFDALAELIDAQAYRLASWRVAMDEINYRRFFDVNDLAAVRMNEPKVFDATHRLLFELIEQGIVAGVRIDHPDGLYDPQTYFDWLQARFRTNDSPTDKPLYLLVEKILAAHERLPASWAVHGTTGYDFAGLIASWLVNTEASVSMTRVYRAFTRVRNSFAEIAYRSKKLVMHASLAAEVAVLATQLDRIAQFDRRTADFTRTALRDALTEVIACFPVYRTYVSARGVSEEDRRTVRWAVGLARKRSRAADSTVFDFLEAVLQGELPSESEEQRLAVLEFAMKFQQVSSPVMAKGIEDTACYVYNRLLCLNEVGADPARFGVSPSALHQANLDRLRSFPHAMLATSTHDTKRSEDVRARIAVLSELPEDWQLHLARWSRVNRSRRVLVGDGFAPSRNDEYLIYQTLLGTFESQGEGTEVTPEYLQRVQDYAIKAARESKRETSWLNPNSEYENGLREFIARLLDRSEHNAFLRDFTKLEARIAYFGWLNSLTQTVLKLTSPGVPDIYQGTELPSLTLVDPDNRRPVDFAHAASLLKGLVERAERLTERSALARELSGSWRSGAAKLYVIWAVLAWRKRDPELWAAGDYEVWQGSGELALHVCAFSRTYAGRRLLVVVPRWCARLCAGEPRLPLGDAVWRDTRIEHASAPVEELTDLLTGRVLRSNGNGFAVSELLQEFPVAVLVGAAQSSDSAITAPQSTSSSRNIER
jgi:(1->4)-alpha-D-glucan 1-alpha-D-glucosylmutase